MSRSFIHLRRALFGISCAIVFGFGAADAYPPPDLVGVPTCESWRFADWLMCEEWCTANHGVSGVCSAQTGTCYCDGW